LEGLVLGFDSRSQPNPNPKATAKRQGNDVIGYGPSREFSCGMVYLQQLIGQDGLKARPPNRKSAFTPNRLA
jgi:hypothetical protein